MSPKTPFTTTAAVAAALVLCTASPAAASAGDGIRLGGSEGRLRPSLELEGRYDSNVFFRDVGDGVGDLVLHVRPGLSLSVPGDLTSVRLRAALDWAQYLGLEEASTKDDLSRLYGEAALGISVNERGQLGLRIDDVFRRSTGTDALLLGAAVITNYNTLRVAAPWRPGGGALQVTVTGDWTLETFEPYLSGPLCVGGGPACDSAQLSRLDYSDVRAGTEVRWRFLPRTAAVLEGGYFRRLPSDQEVTREAAGMRVATGVTGLVTSRVSATVKAGWVDTLGSLDESFRTWLATAELEWLATPTSGVRAGYGHDLGIDPGRSDPIAQESGPSALYTANRGFVEGRLTMGGRFTFRLLGQLEHRTYELVDDTSNTVWRVEPSLDVEAARWLRAGLGYAYASRDSTFPAGAPALPGFDYAKSEAWLRLTATY